MTQSNRLSGIHTLIQTVLEPFSHTLLCLSHPESWVTGLYHESLPPSSFSPSGGLGSLATSSIFFVYLWTRRASLPTSRSKRGTKRIFFFRLFGKRKMYLFLPNPLHLD